MRLRESTIRLTQNDRLALMLIDRNGKVKAVKLGTYLLQEVLQKPVMSEWKFCFCLIFLQYL